MNSASVRVEWPIVRTIVEDAAVRVPLSVPEGFVILFMLHGFFWFDFAAGEPALELTLVSAAPLCMAR